MLLSVKEQLRPEEMVEDPWSLRAAREGLGTEEYCRTAEELDRKQVIGRFATFLEHVRAKTDDGPVTKYNGLFHWTVPSGMEIRAGAECGRHICMTHCYWRTGGDVFGGAQIMGVVHGLEKDAVLEHKAAIDRHLEASGIPILHTAVFWGERSEIKPSEISPELYRKMVGRSKKSSRSAVTPFSTPASGGLPPVEQLFPPNSRECRHEATSIFNAATEMPAVSPPSVLLYRLVPCSRPTAA